MIKKIIIHLTIITFFHDHLSYAQFLHLFNIIKIADLFFILWPLGMSKSENKQDKKYQTNKKPEKLLSNLLTIIYCPIESK